MSDAISFSAFRRQGQGGGDSSSDNLGRCEAARQTCERLSIGALVRRGRRAGYNAACELGEGVRATSDG